MFETTTHLDASTTWKSGRFDSRKGDAKLLFGQMWEDAAIECQLFAKAKSVFAIASAGCTALALARQGGKVLACDINPCQSNYVQSRAAGGPMATGRADRLLMAFRLAAFCVGITPSIRSEFASLCDPAEQAIYWRRHFDKPRVRFLWRWLLSPQLLRSTYAPKFVQSLPDDFADVLWTRLDRGFATHPNRDNPFAPQLLLGRDHRRDLAPCCNIETTCRDACEYLETCPPESFGALTLSNILDGATTEYAQRLAKAVRRAATPDAIVVLRSFCESRTRAEAEWAARDRSFLWGRVIVGRASDFSAD
jgi:S-adenosylmethionine:diacylglycerol 3-amino-3-carboxypropyl transferase